MHGNIAALLLSLLAAVSCVPEPEPFVMEGYGGCFPTLIEYDGRAALVFTDSAVGRRAKPMLALARNHEPRGYGDWMVAPVRGFPCTIDGDCSGARYLSAASSGDTILVAASSSLVYDDPGVAGGFDGAELAWRSGVHDWSHARVESGSTWGGPVAAVSTGSQYAIALPTGEDNHTTSVYLLDPKLDAEPRRVYESEPDLMFLSMCAAGRNVELLLLKGVELQLVSGTEPYAEGDWFVTRPPVIQQPTGYTTDSVAQVFGDEHHVYIAVSSLWTPTSRMTISHAPTERTTDQDAWTVNTPVDDYGIIDSGTVCDGRPFLIYFTDVEDGRHSASAGTAEPQTADDWIRALSPDISGMHSLGSIGGLPAVACENDGACLLLASRADPRGPGDWQLSQVYPRPMAFTKTWWRQHWLIATLLGTTLVIALSSLLIKRRRRSRVKAV